MRKNLRKQCQSLEISFVLKNKKTWKFITKILQRNTKIDFFFIVKPAFVFFIEKL